MSALHHFGNYLAFTRVRQSENHFIGENLSSL